MPTKAYQRFLDSMMIGFDKWHDGTGYDLKALARLGLEERKALEELLIKNLRQAGDWRDVEALVALGTSAAREAVDKARFHRNSEVRHYALKIVLHNLNSKNMTETEMRELEEQVVQAVEHGDYAIAENMPTMRVKKALLESARRADSENRVHAEAFLLYLCGLAPEPFDWTRRPFFLLFADDNPKVLQQAWEELRRRTGF